MESWETALTWVLTITLGFSLAACAGLRAWLPMLVAGLTARFTDQIELGESYQFLESTPALVLFGVATVVEMVGDKFPVVDHALDAFGTVARPVAGALLSAAVLYQVENPLFALGIGILVGAPTAAVPHAVKAASRGYLHLAHRGHRQSPPQHRRGRDRARHRGAGGPAPHRRRLLGPGDRRRDPHLPGAAEEHQGSDAARARARRLITLLRRARRPRPASARRAAWA
jgi:uncharacterized membrane protein